MKVKTEFPFESYNGYISFHKDGRKIINLVKIGNSKDRKTISYSRYIMSLHLGREIEERFEVDHIDGDRLNDDINNLQIINPKSNKIKYLHQFNIGRKIVITNCPNCGCEFKRMHNQSSLVKGWHTQSCSKECSFSLKKSGKINDYINGNKKQEFIISTELYKNRRIS